MARKGFTLVELAIVLVIIGLLMGGVLKGQELINSAKAKTMANDFRAVAGAYHAYLERFRAVPGDDVAADAHVGGTSGDGSGRIEGAWNSVTGTDESYLFWQHVRLAGLLSGNAAPGGANYAPVNADGGRIGISGTSPLPGESSFSGSFFICSAGISGRLAKQIDGILDDGVGNSGVVRAFVSGDTHSSDPSATDTVTPYVVCAAY